MLALQYGSFGEPADVIEPVDTALPIPGPGHVRVRMLRSPIHNHDLATIRGRYGYRPTLPAVGGSELLGRVDAVGEGVTHLREGSRIASGARGAWAEYAIVHAATALPIPDGVPDDVAGQLIAMPLSSVVLFDQLRTQPGMWIGQNAAGGTVGRLLMQIAQQRGVNIINIVRSEKAASELRSYGAQHVVVTREDGEWQHEIRELTGGKGLERIVDSIAGPQTLELQGVLARFGEIVIFGGLSGAPIKLNPSLMVSLECTVRGFWITGWLERATDEERMGAIAQVFQMALAGNLPLPVEAVYPLSDAKAALAAAETPGRSGKVLFST